MSSNKIFEYKVQTKESHLDSFGHINNAVYVQLYEEARWDFINKSNMGLDFIQNTQVGPVLLEMQIRFKREIKNREELIIRSQALELKSSRIILLDQKIINSDKKVASEAVFTIGLMDLKLRKLIDADENWLRAIGFNLP
jgi:acyl-CoA thioester hydrolase